MKVKPIVYLAGPIAGCTDDEAHGWRNETIKQFEDVYEFRNPMVRDFRNKKFQYTKLVEDDLEDIKSSSFLLVNCWQPTFGTPMELVYATRFFKKSSIVIRPKPVSPWLSYHATIVVPDLEKAWELLDLPVWRTHHGG